MRLILLTLLDIGYALSALQISKTRFAHQIEKQIQGNSETKPNSSETEQSRVEKTLDNGTRKYSIFSAITIRLEAVALRLETSSLEER